MKQYLRNNNSSHLTVFFCGWGMDEMPFALLKSSCDILFLYDYVDLAVDFDFSKYETIDLLAFSYGIYAAGLCEKNLPAFRKKIAVNGTLIPVHDMYGVPLKKFLLSQSMSSETIVKFRERLFYNKEHLEIFNENLPERSAQSCTEELLKIQEYFKTLPLPQMGFEKVYVSEFDRVIPTKNQYNFWKMKNVSNIISLESGHFTFYDFESIDEIL